MESTRRPKYLVAAVAGVSLLAACAEPGPATAADVCDAYEELAEELGNANGFFDNGVFNKAKSLGNVAVRYDVDASVMADGDSLKAIGDSDSTSDLALDRASRSISALCGERSLSGYSARLKLGLD